MAVDSLIGLLGRPVGLVAGALTGTLVGAIRDFWVAGADLDFVEEAGKGLRPGKVALIAEVEEEWVTPVDTDLEAAGGHVFRRARNEVAEAQFYHDIAAFKSELEELEPEASHASGAAKTKLQAKIAATKIGLDTAVHRAKQRVDTLKLEADTKAEAVKDQLEQIKGDVKARIEDRVKRVKGAYHARGAKLAQA